MSESSKIGFKLNQYVSLLHFEADISFIWGKLCYRLYYFTVRLSCTPSSFILSYENVSQFLCFRSAWWRFKSYCPNCGRDKETVITFLCFCEITACWNEVYFVIIRIGFLLKVCFSCQRFHISLTKLIMSLSDHTLSVVMNHVCTIRFLRVLWPI